MEEMFGITNWLEQVNDEDVNFVGSVFKLLLSMVLGAMVGLERRHKGQIAGMRTFALISMGARWRCWCPFTSRRSISD